MSIVVITKTTKVGESKAGRPTVREVVQVSIQRSGKPDGSMKIAEPACTKRVSVKEVPKKEKKAPLSISEQLEQLIGYVEQKHKPHVDVFPDAPKKGELAIPTGGLAKCICSTGCTKELPQPAYRIIGEAEEYERWDPEEAPLTAETLMAQVAEFVKNAQDDYTLLHDYKKAQKAQMAARK